MYKEIKILECDRCGKTIYENDDEYRLLIAGGEIDLCCKCSDRFKKFWNEFFRPDPFSEIPPFKPNEKMMYKSVTGEVIN